MKRDEHIESWRLQCPEGHSRLASPARDGSVVCRTCREKYDQSELVDSKREVADR